MNQQTVHRLKIVFSTVWGGLILTVLFLWWRSHLSLTSVPALLEQGLRDFGLFKPQPFTWGFMQSDR